jgi:hypothetical protein
VFGKRTSPVSGGPEGAAASCVEEDAAEVVSVPASATAPAMASASGSAGSELASTVSV